MSDHMLLSRRYHDPELNLTLELFLRMLRDLFGEQLVSLMLYGSVLFDDLSPGYGDLDFIAVVKDDLSCEMTERLDEMRKPLRGGDYGILAAMLEGAFLPRKMLDPAVRGCAFWWGTTRNVPREYNDLGPFVLKVIWDMGHVAWGQDVRGDIPPVSHEELLDELGSYCRDARQNGLGGGIHSVDWLLTTARMLLWLRDGRFSSKSEAADWGNIHARGAWREYLPKAADVRRRPWTAGLPDTGTWLESLSAPIQDALDELEEELARPQAL